jgi:hypothetical protein
MQDVNFFRGEGLQLGPLETATGLRSRFPVASAERVTGDTGKALMILLGDGNPSLLLGGALLQYEHIAAAYSCFAGALFSAKNYSRGRT